MNRCITPELLDSLTPTAPEAIKGRKDLELINALMGNWRWLRRDLEKHLQHGDRLIEIGAGTGASAAQLQKALGCAEGAIAVTGLDLVARPPTWPDHWDWIEQDLLACDDLHRFDVVIANLVLHHFSETQLASLGKLLRSGPRVLIACEPARRSAHWWQARALAILGVNHITRHDAPASVRAGFCKRELPDWLGLTNGWSVSLETTWLGAYRIIAVRDGTG